MLINELFPLHLPYHRHIPPIFGSRIYDHDTVLNQETTKIIKVYANIVSTTFIFGEDNILRLEGDRQVGRLSIDFFDNNSESALSEYCSNKNNQAEQLHGPWDVIIPLVHPGSQIYGHWLIDLLSKVRLFEILHPDIKYAIALEQNTPDFALNLIHHLLGDQQTIIKLNDSHLYYANIFVVSPFRYHDYLQELSCLIRPNINQVLGKRRVYITRRDFDRGYRSLTNRNDVESYFIERGFELISPETLSIAEQIKIFGEVEILAGEAGSGLHNSILCPKNAKIINIQSSRQNHFIQAGINYWSHQLPFYVFGKTETNDWNSNFSINLSAIGEALDFAYKS